MKIKSKISISIFFISLLILASTIYANFFLNYNEQLNSEKNILTNNAFQSAKDIENGLLDKLSNTITIGSAPIVTKSLLRSNSVFKNMDNKEKHIATLNKKWMTTKSKDDSFISSYLQNELALFLKKQQKILPDEYGELFITNKYGAMIAATAKLTTLAHAQKYWWREAFNNAKGKVFFDDRGFDLSANSYVVGVVIPIRYKDEVIGILKANVKIMRLLSTTVKNYLKKNLGSLKIVRTKGLVVYENNLTPLSTKVNAKILNALKEKENSCIIIKESTDNNLVSYAPIRVRVKGKDISFGGETKSIDHNKGNSGEIWHAVITYDKKLAFRKFRQTNKLILFIGIILSVFSAISAFIIARWISKPVEKLQLAHKKIKEQDKIILSQSRHAAMGEMISMIAHQWRQPISAIAMSANNILADIELEIVDEKTLKTTSLDIINQTQELSKTINDFRNFFKPEKIAEDISVRDVIKNTLGAVEASLINNNIQIIQKYAQEHKVHTYSRELMQVLINILNNAKEALVESRKTDRKITIAIEHKNDNTHLSICDNAGGIDEKIINEIFNPYFSTKDKKNGTGLGLYMSKTIIEKHLHGALIFSNKDEGACFEIIFPNAITNEDLE